MTTRTPPPPPTPTGGRVGMMVGMMSGMNMNMNMGMMNNGMGMGMGMGMNNMTMGTGMNMAMNGNGNNVNGNGGMGMNGMRMNGMNMPMLGMNMNTMNMNNHSMEPASPHGNNPSSSNNTHTATNGIHRHTVDRNTNSEHRNNNDHPPLTPKSAALLGLTMTPTIPPPTPPPLPQRDNANNPPSNPASALSPPSPGRTVAGQSPPMVSSPTGSHLMGRSPPLITGLGGRQNGLNGLPLNLPEQKNIMGNGRITPTTGTPFPYPARTQRTDSTSSNVSTASTHSSSSNNNNIAPFIPNPLNGVQPPQGPMSPSSRPVTPTTATGTPPLLQSQSNNNLSNLVTLTVQPPMPRISSTPPPPPPSNRNSNSKANPSQNSTISFSPSLHSSSSNTSNSSSSTVSTLTLPTNNLDDDSMDGELGNYRPRVTIFERAHALQQQHLMSNAHTRFGSGNFVKCRQNDCYSKAEANSDGLCYKHFYDLNSRKAAAASASAAPSGTLTPMARTKREDERAKLAEELVSTEKTYVQNLKIAVRIYQLRLKKYEELEKPLITSDENSKIFQNVQDILDLHRKVYNEAKKLKNEQRLLSSSLGRMLRSFAPFFKLYIRYVNGYEESNRMLQSLREKKADFDFFLKVQEACEGLRLEDYLITPVQRIPRYLLLLRGIERNSEPTEELYRDLKSALDALEDIAEDINKSIHDNEARLRVFEVQNHVEGLPYPIVTPTRYHVKDGPLQKKYAKSSFKMSSFNKYWFFLFNDLLMYTTVPNKQFDCKLKYMLQLNDMTILDIPDGKLDGVDCKHAFQIQCPTVKDLVVCAQSEQEKREWMEVLCMNINQYKRNISSLKPSSAESDGPSTVGGGGGGGRDIEAQRYVERQSAIQEAMSSSGLF